MNGLAEALWPVCNTAHFNDYKQMKEINKCW